MIELNFFFILKKIAHIIITTFRRPLFTVTFNSKKVVIRL